MLRSVRRACLGVVALPLLLSLCLCGAARCAESGASHYAPGAYGDFLMAYIPGPGLSARNDLVYQSGHLGGALKGGREFAGLDQSMTTDIVTITKMFDVPAIGGYLGAGFGVPVIVNEHVTGDAVLDYRARSRRGAWNQLALDGGGDRGGISDIFIMPVIAGWAFGDCHLTVTPMLFLPTGYYDKDSLTSLGMNYFTFDGNVAFTWFHEQRYEFSFNAGYMINTENMATRYLSGNQVHLDWTLAYHVNASLALGAAGYWFFQTTPDSGPGASLGGFYSSGAGAGPAVTFTAPILGKDVSFVAKWLQGIGASNSFLGETAYGSFILNF